MKESVLTHEEACALVEDAIERCAKTLAYIRLNLENRKTNPKTGVQLSLFEQSAVEQANLLCNINWYGGFLRAILSPEQERILISKIMEDLKDSVPDAKYFKICDAEDKVKRTERGWAGLFCCADRCLFRRNTLLVYHGWRVIVSTVGRMPYRDGKEFEAIGRDRHFETRVFMSCGNKWDGIDSGKPVSFESERDLPEPDMELEANEMHENVVNEITGYLLAGTLKYGEE